MRRRSSGGSGRCRCGRHSAPTLLAPRSPRSPNALPPVPALACCAERPSHPGGQPASPRGVAWLAPVAWLLLLLVMALAGSKGGVLPTCLPACLQTEEQFAQLRSLIQVGLQQAVDLAAWRQAQAVGHDSGPSTAGGMRHHGAGEQPPPPPLHASPRLRATEAVSSADADVAAAHPRAGPPGDSAKVPHSGSRRKHTAARRGSPEPHTEVHFG